MNSDNTIQLSGPFSFTDSAGRLWPARGIRIYDEGYGIIDVYVELDTPADVPLHEDPLVVSQILWRLRALGYNGPDFGPGDPGLQEDGVIVLEAPEAFGRFAAAKGWKNLAEEYRDHRDHQDQWDEPLSLDLPADPATQLIYAELMRRIMAR